MNTTQENCKNKRAYRRPSLRIIEFDAEDVLGGCWINGASRPTAPGPCGDPAPCALIP